MSILQKVGQVKPSNSVIVMGLTQSGRSTFMRNWASSIEGKGDVVWLSFGAMTNIERPAEWLTATITTSKEMNDVVQEILKSKPKAVVLDDLDELRDVYIFGDLKMLAKEQKQITQSQYELGASGVKGVIIALNDANIPVAASIKVVDHPEQGIRTVGSPTFINKMTTSMTRKVLTYAGKDRRGETIFTFVEGFDAVQLTPLKS